MASAGSDAGQGSMSAPGQKAKFRGDQRMSALASRADISRFKSTRPSQQEFDPLKVVQIGKYIVW